MERSSLRNAIVAFCLLVQLLPAAVMGQTTAPTPQQGAELQGQLFQVFDMGDFMASRRCYKLGRDTMVTGAALRLEMLRGAQVRVVGYAEGIRYWNRFYQRMVAKAINGATYPIVLEVKHTLASKNTAKVTLQSSNADKLLTATGITADQLTTIDNTAGAILAGKTLSVGDTLVRRAVLRWLELLDQLLANAKALPVGGNSALEVQFYPAANGSATMDTLDGPARAAAFDQLVLNGRQLPVRWQAGTVGKPLNIVPRVTVVDTTAGVTQPQYRATGAAVSSGEQLTITPTGTTSRLEAYYMLADSSGATTPKVCGVLNLASYPARILELMVVPVNSAPFRVSERTLADSLNAIYAPAQLTWTVAKGTALSIESLAVQGHQFKSSGRELLSSYTDDMNAVIEAFKRSPSGSSNAYVLFLIPGAQNASRSGFMPYNRHFGFLFTDAISSDQAFIRTAAHELGHGAFNLRHPWLDIPALAQGSTTNLMDYSPSGERLWKTQWDEIADPKSRINIFSDEEEMAGVLVTDLSVLNDIKFDNSDGSFTFMSPSGLPVTLPPRTQEIVFRSGERWESSVFKMSAFGTLHSFKIGDTLYVSKADPACQNFLYYESSNGTKYVDKLSRIIKPTKAIIGFPSYESDKIVFRVFQNDLLPTLGNNGGAEKNDPYYANGPLVPFNYNFFFFFNNPNRQNAVEIPGYINLSEEAIDYLKFRKQYATCNSDFSPYIFANAQQINNNPNTYYFCDLNGDLYKDNPTWETLDELPANPDPNAAIQNGVDTYLKEIDSWEKGIDVYSKRSAALKKLSAIQNIENPDDIAELFETLSPYACVWEGMKLQDRVYALQKILVGNVNDYWFGFGNNKENLFNILVETTPVGVDRIELLKKFTDNSNELLNRAYSALNLTSNDKFIYTICGWISDYRSFEIEGLKYLTQTPTVTGEYITPDKLFVWSAGDGYPIGKLIRHDGSSGQYYWLSTTENRAIVVNPFDLIKVRFESNFIGGIKAGDEMIVPVIWAYRFEDNLKKEQLVATAKILVDGAIILASMGTATPVVSSLEVTMSYIDGGMALSDLVFTGVRTDIITQYGTSGEDFLQSWDNIYSIYGSVLGLRYAATLADGLKSGFTIPSISDIYSKFNTLSADAKLAVENGFLKIATALNRMRPANWQKAYYQLLDFTNTLELQRTLRQTTEPILLQVKDYSTMLVSYSENSYKVATFEMKEGIPYLSDVQWLPKNTPVSNVKELGELGNLHYEGAAMGQEVDNASLQVVKAGERIYLRELATAGDAITELIAQANAKFGKQVIDNLPGAYIDEIEQIVTKHGLTLDEFEKLIQRPVEGIDLDGFSVSYLTPAERKVVESIRLDLIKSFDENTVFEKTIPQGDALKYAENIYSPQVGGFISTAQDVKQLNTSEKVYYGMRLDYKEADNPFTPSQSKYFMRFTTAEYNKVSLPTSKKYPNTGHGFTAGNHSNLGIPELQVSSGKVEIKDAAIYRRLGNGDIEVVAKYNPDTKKFEKIAEIHD